MLPCFCINVERMGSHNLASVATHLSISDEVAVAWFVSLIPRAHQSCPVGVISAALKSIADSKEDRVNNCLSAAITSSLSSVCAEHIGQWHGSNIGSHRYSTTKPFLFRCVDNSPLITVQQNNMETNQFGISETMFKSLGLLKFQL